MRRILFPVTLAALSVSCGGNAATNSNSVNVNIAVPPAVNAPATPEIANTGNSNAASAPAANSPASSKGQAQPPTALGTPAKANVAPESGKKPGATPTPGIPSPEEIKRMMAHPPKVDPNAPTGQAPMMKPNRPLGGRMTSNSNKP